MFGAKADGARDIVVAALNSSQRDAFAPAPRPRGVPDASGTRALVTTCSLAPRQVVLLTPASPTAIPIAAIAAAAHDDLHTAPDAKEQTGWTVQRHHQTEPVVLDGIVPARHTDAAPPSSARCRARRGHQAARRERTAAVPTFFGSSRVVLHRIEPSRAAANASACARRISSDARHGTDGDGLENCDVRRRSDRPGRPAGRPGAQPPHRSAVKHELPRAAAA